MTSPSAVKEMILAGLPGAQVEVADMTGTGDHFDILVISEKFAGKPLIEQHQMVMGILEKEIDKSIHAVKIKTRVPSQKNPVDPKLNKQEWSGRHVKPRH